MFINFSNHPYDKWSEEQKAAAVVFGEVLDVPFPSVPGNADEDQITRLAEESTKKILSHIDKSKENVVMVQGEFTLTYAVVSILLSMGITAVSACAERRVTETVDENGTPLKQVVFQFERFRKYG